jgi:hypothetical protein
MHMAEADRLFGTVKADEMAKDPSQLPVWTKNEVVGWGEEEGFTCAGGVCG